jgi:hypothetical protein
MTYLCKFDDDGKRIATVVSGVHFNTDEEKADYIADGYIETSDDDYAYYVGNKGTGANGTGYIRGEDGKPTDAPAYVPSVEEQLAQLDAQYNADKAVLSEQYTMAMLTDDTELAEELKAELVALNEDYDKAYEEIVGGE